MLTTTKAKRAMVIGAGPMGLETALHCLARGFETTVLEAGRVGENIRRWGHIRMFSPFAMNLSPLAREILGSQVPPDDSIQTGDMFVKTVLEPLAQSERLRNSIHTNRRVIAIARTGLGKMGLPGHPLRSERSFRVLAEDDHGREHVYHADLVFDASGVFGQPNWSGHSGMPAPGERLLKARIFRHPPKITQTSAFVNKHTLVIGHGHSAGNTVLALAKLTQEFPATAVTWIVRSDRARPVIEVAADPLHERDQIAKAANDVAQEPPAGWRVLRRCQVESFSLKEPAIAVTLKIGKMRQAVEVDEIISLTGYRPNLDMLRETTVSLSDVSEGTAGLYRALTNVTDCLAKIDVNFEDLQSGEPGLFIVGIKSYGRNSGFLLRSGIEQLDAIFNRTKSLS